MKRYSRQFTQDQDGQWWHTRRSGAKQRAVIRTCPNCKEDFPSYEKRSHCSHKCALLAYHARVQPTTVFDGTPKNADNPRFSKDDQGQWWYTPQGTKQHGRTRAKIHICVHCSSPFLASMFHKTSCCSKSCGLRVSYAKSGIASDGKNSRSWRGGRVIRHGYALVWAPDHHSIVGRGTKRRYVLEHRLVMEQMLGRPMLPTEQVHHKNGIRDDNRPENLELWAKQQPPGQRVTEQKHCPTCSCGGK